MYIDTFGTIEWLKKYNLQTGSTDNKLNFSGQCATGWLSLFPQTTSTPHRHHEVERLVVFKGQGRLHIQDDNSTHILEEGHVVTILPFEMHSIENTHAEDQLLILSLVVNDTTKLFPKLQVFNKLLHKNYLVISTPPTPNGDLHLGHLAGPYLKADVLKRFLALNYKASYHLTSQDSNQSYTKRKAEVLECDPDNLANYFGGEIQSTLIKSDVKLDYFTNPKTNSVYKAKIKSIILQLWSAGKIVVRESQMLICESCNHYLYEAYIRGLCPHCSTDTGGNFCEACGHSNDCIDLADPKCSVCKSVPIRKTVSRAYFPLASYLSGLLKYHQETISNKRLQALCDSFIKAGLKDVPVTHPTDWGMPCPISGLEDQIISVWFEMGVGHLASTAAFINDKNPEQINDVSDFWTGDSATVLYTFGFDNSFFNCILFPCIFLAIDEKINLPSGLYFNEFYCLEGLKFSTSRNHLVWTKEFLKDHSSDMMRFYLCYTCPDTAQRSFEKSEFDQLANDIHSKLTNSLSSLEKKLSHDFHNNVPCTGLWLPSHIEFYESLLLSIKRIAECYHPQTFSLRSAAHAIFGLINNIQIFIHANIETQSISFLPDEHRTSMALGLLSLKILSTCAHPIMPRTSDQLAINLGYSETQSWGALLDWVPDKQQIYLSMLSFDLLS